MDVVKALAELYQEKRRLDTVIAQLEQKQRRNVREIPKPVKRRGRKSMSPEERLAVSLRMADYWAARRAARTSEPQPAAMAQPPSMAKLAIA